MQSRPCTEARRGGPELTSIMLPVVALWTWLTVTDVVHVGITDRDIR